MKVGIIGAGTMGSGIAQAFAQSNGYEVLLCDINEEFAANGKNKIAKGLNGRVAKGKMEQAAADAILAKITTGTKEICKDCDLVIEAAIENMEVKKQTFQELSQICKPECMFATILPPSPSPKSALSSIVPSSACISSIPLLL